MACHNVLDVRSDSSLLVYLDKDHHDKKEIWSWTYDQQQLNNTNTFQGWKDCINTDDGISYRTPRVRALLVNHFEYVPYNVPWVRKYNNTKTPFDTLQRRTAMSITCKYCGNPIVFDDNTVSKNGTRKPLNEWDHNIHDCKFSPFNKSRESALERKALGRIEEWQVIEDLRNQIAATNNRLWNYELELVVRYKED